jgi:anti-anti-sigma factor
MWRSVPNKRRARVAVWFPYAAGRQSAMPDDAQPWPDGPFRAEATGDDTEPVIIVEGELDMSGTDRFMACVAAVLQNQPRSIVVDARGLSFMDSSGLQSLLRARAEAAQAGVGFRISDPSPPVRRFLERTGLREVLLED